MRLLPVNTLGSDETPLRVQRRDAFTLVEILLVVALLGIIASAFVSGAADLFRSKEPRAEDVFWQAVTSARQLALESNENVVLHYDQEKHLLGWEAESKAGQTLPFPGKQLDFLPVTSQSSILIAGQLIETGAIKFVRFYPDGCCDAFRAQVVDDAGRGSLLSIDPWTCAPILAATTK